MGFVVEVLYATGAGVHLAEAEETTARRETEKRARAIARTYGICGSC